MGRELRARGKRFASLLAVLLQAAPADLHAQRVVTISGAPACRGCIELRRVAVLGGTSDPSSVQPTANVARLADGSYYVTPTGAAGEISVYNSTGRYLRSIGRSGRGPGEFGDLITIVGATDTTLTLLDQSRYRWSVLDRMGRYLAGGPIELPSWYEGTRLSDGRFVFSSIVRTPDRAGFPLHILGRDGRIEASTGGTMAFRADREHETFRVLGEARLPGGFWSAYPLGNTIELYAGSGERQLVVQRQADWYTGTVSPQRMNAWPPPHWISRVWEDSAGRLWTVVSVAAVPPKTTQESRQDTTSFAALLQQALRTVIEVVDVQGQRLLATLEHPRFLQRGIGGDFYYSIVETPDGDTRTEIWTVTTRW